MLRQRMLMHKRLLLVVVWGLVGGMGSLGETYEATQVHNGGVITGSVKVVGAVPPPEQLTITRDLEVCGAESRPSEALIISADGSLKNVVVSIENMSQGKPQPALEENPKLVQEKCWFSPHVLLVPAGSTVDLFNHDKVMHNIHTTSQINPIINKAQPSFIKKLSFPLRKPEVIKARCDFHSWMSAWFIVTEHPYYTLTEANGSFTLTDVPPGAYTLRAWHEVLGKQSQQVSVRANEETKVVFEFTQ